MKQLVIGKVMADGRIQHLGYVSLSDEGKALLLNTTPAERARQAVNRAFNGARTQFKIGEIVDNHWSKLDTLWNMVLAEIEKEFK